MNQRPSLRERKQKQAREQIVEAAFELFAERGFAEVTVTDIAERAEVGRTTFFRYFGDKQEVVFSDEQQLLDHLAERQRALPGGAPQSLPAALEQIRALVLEVCTEATTDAERYEMHQRLVEQNTELKDRSARKLQRFAELGEAILLERGTPREVAVLAAQIAVACYQAGNRLAGADAPALAPAVDVAFGQLDALLDPNPVHGFRGELRPPSRGGGV
ncbi:AcrR family transcriptional regulator [Amycolatopsis lexingtonensis]|uniref:AcrR family transcriptional regulator n=1 Tax=Amycolatopsis lexingtonensis TaxID=218822 RepID=A0ABR9IA04_9PSEU|nr:TetR family transcriptional regulator [Amycolatopsis lexingtonensis]MBE1500007.1 AcrR family transcriptional regulator [Amycolatopsis lexingtonensis]